MQFSMFAKHDIETFFFAVTASRRLIAQVRKQILGSNDFRLCLLKLWISHLNEVT